jgi:hypothetical protein
LVIQFAEPFFIYFRIEANLPIFALIAKEPKPTDFETMLRGQDSDLLRELMGLPGKPFPTLPRRSLS